MRRFGESLTTRLPRCPKPTELTSSICAVHVHPNAHSCSQLWRNQRRNPRFIESASQTHMLKRPPGPLFTQSQALEAQLSILPTTHSLGKGYHRPEFRHRFSAVPGDPRARIEVGRSYRAFARTRLLLTTSVPSNRKTLLLSSALVTTSCVAHECAAGGNSLLTQHHFCFFASLLPTTCEVRKAWHYPNGVHTS